MTSNQSRNRGLAKCSRIQLNSKESNSKPSTANEEISQYFTPSSSKLEIANASPYKCLTEIKQIELNDENDFKTPPPIRMTRSGAQRAKVPAKRKYTKKTKTKKDSFQQKTLEHFCNDVNPEHLQLALALSVQEMEKPEDVKNDDCGESSSYPSTQQIRENARRTLEQYGFHSSRKRDNDRVTRVNSEVNSRKKKSRFYYIPSTLMTRTKEDREDLINSKISQILNQSCDINTPTDKYELQLLQSDILREIYCENKLYKINCMNLEELNTPKCLYVQALNFEEIKYRCGSFLKKWEDIPGRDLTPPREIKKSENNNVEENSITSQLPIESISDVELEVNSFINELSYLTDKECDHDDKKSVVNFNNTTINIAENDCDDLNLFNNTTIALEADEEINQELSKINENCDESIFNDKTINTSDTVKTKVTNLSESICDKSALNQTTTSTPTQKSFRKYVSVSPDLFDSEEDDTIENPLSVDELNNITNSQTDTGNEEIVMPKNVLGTIVESPILSYGSKFKRKFSSVLNNECKKQLNISDDLSDCDIMETDNGICHFESFCDEGKILSQKCMDKNDTIDLTQSSDSENEFNSNIQKSISDDNELVDENKTKLRTDIGLEKSQLMEDKLASPRISDYNKSLNATAYVNNLLNNCAEITFKANESSSRKSPLKCSKIDTSPLKDIATGNNDSANVLSDNIENDFSKFKKHDSTASIDSSISQDSIYISDEELNYSSVYCTPKRKSKIKPKYEISDSESDDGMETNIDMDNVDVNNILKKLHAEAAENKRNKSLLEAVIDISDDDDSCKEVLQNRGDQILQNKDKENLLNKDEENLQNRENLQYRDETIELNLDNQSITSFNQDENDLSDTNNEEASNDIPIMDVCENFEPIQPPLTPNTTPKTGRILSSKKIQHPRVAELSNNRKSFHTTAFFDDTFANMLEESSVIKGLDNITPEKSKLITDPILTPQGTTLLKISDVTPMPNYDSMDTPQIEKELDKYGLKKLKRQRGAYMLKYLYDSTHPALNDDDEETGKVVKKRRKLIDDENDEDVDDVTNSLNLENVSEVLKLGSGDVQIVGDALSDRLSIGEMIFEKKQLKKILSCQLPLHIAWHNLLAAHPELRENILLYEPLQVEVLYGMLKEQGFKFHIQDLISFLDKKCITIRIAQNQSGPRTKKNSK